MAKTAKDAASEAVSKNEAGLEPGNVTQQSTALVETKEGDISGPMQLVLSPELQDKLMLEFQEALHQVEAGFGSLTAPGDVAAMQTPFDVIDAITIDDFEDRKTGEVKVKHVFALELPDGRVLHTMQSDARPRRMLANMFRAARSLGQAIAAGPYTYEKKVIPGQIQAAWIFAQQPGFKVRPQQQSA